MTPIRPISPVDLTCVPPQADRSKFAISMSRSTPALDGSFRSGNCDAAADETNRIITGRFSQTTAFAASTAPSMSLGDASRSRSIVETSAPM
jgi:hypothetical protein